MSSLCLSLNVFPVSVSVFFVSASVLLSQLSSFYVIKHLPVSVICLCHPASSCVSHYLSMSSSIFLCQPLSFYFIHHLPVSVIIFLCQPASSCATHRLSHVSLSLSLHQIPVSVCSRVSVFLSQVCAKISFPCLSHISVFQC